MREAANDPVNLVFILDFEEFVLFWGLVFS
jgi:hypothetical protein